MKGLLNGLIWRLAVQNLALSAKYAIIAISELWRWIGYGVAATIILGGLALAVRILRQYL